MTMYIIRAALHEETNEGWIWARGFGSRTIAKITNPSTCRSVYCQLRKIDENFTTQYNKSPRYSLIEADTLVMSQWYRDALGGFEPSNKNNTTGLIDLRIKPLCWLLRWWGSLRAAAHHPEIVVRIGIKLGVLGAGLGLVALIPPLLEITAVPESRHPYVIVCGATIALLVGLLFCRRPPPIH